MTSRNTRQHTQRSPDSSLAILSSRARDAAFPSRNELLQVYEIERHDEQNTAAIITAIIVGTVAYFAGATAYLSEKAAKGTLPDFVIMAAPFPLLILSGYVTFHYAASRLRQSYLMYLESEAIKHRQWEAWKRTVNYPGYVTLHQGLFNGWGWQAPFALLTAVTLFAHIVAVAGFTVYVVQYIGDRISVAFSTRLLFQIVYTFMITLNFTAMVMILTFAGTSRGLVLKSLLKRASTTGQDECLRWQNALREASHPRD